VDFIIANLDVILKNSVPFLQYYFVRSGSGLRCDQLLEVSNGVIRVTLDTNLLAKTIVARDLNHFEDDEGEESECAEGLVEELFPIKTVNEFQP